MTVIYREFDKNLWFRAINRGADRRPAQLFLIKTTFFKYGNIYYSRSQMNLQVMGTGNIFWLQK